MNTPCRCNGVGVLPSIALALPTLEQNRFTPTSDEVRAAQVRTTPKTVNLFGAIIPIYNKNGVDVVFRNGRWLSVAGLGQPTSAQSMNLTRFSNYGPQEIRLGARDRLGVTPKTAVTYGVNGWFDDLWQGISNPSQAQNTGGGVLGGTLGNILVQVTSAFASKTVLEASGARESGRYIQTPTGNIPIYVLNGVDVVYDGSKFIPASQVAKTAQQEARQSITDTFSTWILPIAVAAGALYFFMGRKR